MFSSRDQYTAPDFSHYPDYNDYERPVPVSRQPSRPHREHMDAAPVPAVPVTPAPPVSPRPMHGNAPWYSDRFMLVLVFLVAICLYNMTIISRLEAELSAYTRVGARPRV